MLNNEIFNFIYNARKAATLANMFGMDSRKQIMEEFQLSKTDAHRFLNSMQQKWKAAGRNVNRLKIIDKKWLCSEFIVTSEKRGKDLGIKKIVYK